MEGERWRNIDRLYHLALRQEPGRRTAFLEQACGGDEELREELVSLLAQADGTGGFLEAPALEVAAQALARAAGTLPAAIGHYRIIRLLGEGGMGSVYEAEQQEPRRIVALKVIRPGLSTPEHLWRFKHESRALGRLQHPGIAQIYEASTAETALGPQPYFAMELIRGFPLTEYAGSHRLDTRQKLLLLVKVSEAVDHAHQRGLIHRDLKPGNILVDATGQPKILDFGVARVLESEAQPTRQTDLGQLIGTLPYMSPEQVLGNPLEIDTRSDIYSLGVILYELLTGRLPYDVRRRQLPEAVRTIREEEPASLSSINRAYRGDIQTIVGKSLEKDKARRYASAADLAADIQRHLNDEPITARPPSTSYQLYKFARRHRGLVAGAAAVFVVLLAGIAVSASQAFRANREAATAKAVSNFLQQDLLAQASARTQARRDSRPDPDLKVRTALDRAAASVAGKFPQQPLVEASIRQTIGLTYRDLGIYPDAQKQLEAALKLRRSRLGEENPDTLKSMHDLAGVYDDEGKYPQAEPLYLEALQAQRRVLGAEHPDTLATASDLGWFYSERGKDGQAELVIAKALAAERRVLGNEHPQTLGSMNALAVVYRSEGKYAQAEPLYLEAFDIQRRVLGESHPDTLVTMIDLASLYRVEGKYAQAEPLQTTSLEIQRRVLGEQHADTQTNMNNLGVLYQLEGRYADAEPLLTALLDLRRRTLGDENLTTVNSMNNLAVLYGKEGKFADAERLMANTLAVRNRMLGAQHPLTLMTMANQAFLYQLQGKYGEAQPLVAKALEGARRVEGEEHPDTLRIRTNQGLLYGAEGRFAQAEPILSKVLEARRRVLGPEHPDSLASGYNLANLYRSQGRSAEAAALLTSVLEARRRVLGPSNPDSVAAISLLGDIRLQRREFDSAESLLREVVMSDEKTAVTTWRRYWSQSLLGACLAAKGKFAEAEPLLLSGFQGMRQRAATIPFEERQKLQEAAQRVAARREHGK
jgi:serine/threonine protein kinase/Flp pilus assembly protein TadD